VWPLREDGDGSKAGTSLFSASVHFGLSLVEHVVD
jgi:hypothetical protein